jgi:hypothetical protein
LRDSVRSLVPELARAQSSGDWDGWKAVAARAAAHWDAIRAAYLGAVIIPERRARMERLMDAMTADAHGTLHHDRDE